MIEEIEIWKDIPEYEGLYQVSNFGKVKSLPRNTTKGGILKPRKNRGGYLQLQLTKNGIRKTFTIHKLVALAFILNPENLPCVNHKDENKENNHVDNLEFCTIQYNNCYGSRIERMSKNISLSLKGKYVGENSPFYGKHHTEETKQKLRKPKSEEHKKKLSQALKGKRKTSGGYIWRYK